MSTTARDKAWADRVRKAAREMYPHAKVRDRYDADLLMAGFEDGADWGRASVLSALTEERIAETIYTAEKHAEYGDQWTETWDEESSSYQEPYRASARAVLALIEQKTTK